MKRVAFHTLGCKLNFAETATLGQQFTKHGYRVVDIHQPADVVVINSCSVTDHAERECRQVIRRALRQSPHAFVAVVGCYAQLHPEEIAKIPGVQLVLGTNEKFNLLQYLKSKQTTQTEEHVSCIDTVVDVHEASSLGFGERTRIFLKVQEGCDYPCTYCTIPLARGKSRSVPSERIVQSARDAVEQGYKEIVLTGVNVGDYGKHSNEKLVDVLRRLSQLDGLERIRVSSIEPNLLDEELLDFWFSEKKVCKHWHIPLQSGSNTILRDMKRRYRRELYQEKVWRIKQAIPTAGIGADVIVGFPGETDLLFEETVKFIEELPVTYLHVFSFSARPNTPASTYPAQVPPQVRSERSERLRALGAEKRRNFLHSFIGKTVEVLAESEHGSGVYSGLTEEYVRVEFSSTHDVRNTLMPVTITDVEAEYAVGTVPPYVSFSTERNVA